MALRLRYQIDSARRLRKHVHLVDGAGYFFFSAAVAPKGTLASLEIDFTSTAQVALMRGWVWARSAGGGLWLELAGAEKCLDKLDRALQRREPRLASDQLVLAEPEGLPALLCRLREVSGRGARLAAMPADAGEPGQRMRVKLAEAGPSGEQLTACGRVVWASEGEIGIEWQGSDPAVHPAVRRLLQNARREWEEAKTASHPGACRCLGRCGPPPLVLLG
ncbi:MAG TPA: PilZ domain-containing protein [Myxococcales bacterium]|nr:PilZ domain-containing protein [Myxococcales bacterium]